MSDPTFSIDRSLFSLFPGLFFAWLIVEELPHAAIARESRNMLQNASAETKARFEGTEDLAAQEPIASWRGAYGAMKVKPSKYRSSIEALIRRAVRGDDLSIFPAVDLYNSFSLKHMVPMGASDLDLLPQREVVLRACNAAHDSYTPLGGKAEDFPLIENLPVYASGNTVLCWALNCRDSAIAALRPETRRALFVTEGVNAGMRDAGTRALAELQVSLEKHGAICRSGLVDSETAKAKAA